jgi:pyruvate kinase
MRNAKIVCTIGPASDSKEDLRELIAAGMNVVRMNASHGTPEDREQLIDRVREVSDAMNQPVGVMHDLPGPEVRTASQDGTVHLEDGSTITYVTGSEMSNEAKNCCTV